MTMQKTGTPQTTHKSYQGYSAHVTDAEALIAFEAKYGRKPKGLIRTGGGVRVGPLHKEEVR